MLAEHRFPFVVLEGPDGAGKTTLREMTIAQLWERGLPVYHIGQHSWLSPVATRTILDVRLDRHGWSAEEISAAYIADKVSQAERNVKPFLSTAAILADRYLHSDVVYHEALYGIPMARTLDAYARSDILLPDLVVYVDVDVDTSMSRVHGRGKALRPFERPDVMARVIERYRDLFVRGGDLRCRSLTVENRGGDPRTVVAEHIVPAILSAVPKE